MDKYHSPFGFPDEHMRLIGIITAHWEHVENFIEAAVAKIMELDPNRIRLLTMNISFHPKTDLLLAYARAAFLRESDTDPRWTAFNELVKELRNAYSARNRYVHAKWDFQNETMFRYDVRTKGGKLTIEQEITTTTELAEAAQQILDAGEHFMNFLAAQGIDFSLPGKS
jgi:hypothetical protein